MNNTIETVRVITDHAVDPIDEKLTITALDAPGAGGASFLYRITGFDSFKNASCPAHTSVGVVRTSLAILFQNGPPDAFGVNGITNEALLAIVADRLRGFQSGPFACEENECALLHVEDALRCLKYRTRERMQRGVEGTYKA